MVGWMFINGWMVVHKCLDGMFINGWMNVYK